MSLSKSSQNTGQVEKPCEVCEVSYQIQWKCFDCKRYMCSACKETIHPKFKHADKHKIIKTKDITSEDLEEKPDLTSISCTVHDGKLCCLYCKDCGDVICSLCVTQIHSKHKMIELSEGYAICIKRLQQFTMQIDERIRFIKLSEIGRYVDGKKKMMMQERQLKQAIKSHTEILNREYERQWRNFNDTISKEEAMKTETNRIIFNSAVSAADANETFRVARKGNILLAEEMTRINIDIERPQSFVPRLISTTSIKSVHGRLKVIHKKPIVAAIEIGTNRVGVSVCFRHRYEGYLSKHFIRPQSMEVYFGNIIGHRRPLFCVLLKPNGTVHSIGNEALYNYEQTDKTTSDWFLFECLGGTLDKDKIELTNDTWLSESRNNAGCKLKKMKALDVFASVISYIKGKTVEELVRTGKDQNICIEDIFWILTIPNIKAEQFIYDAAQKANTSNEDMTIINETDALSEFCESIKQNFENIEPQTEISHSYLMFDIGDGTKDITLHEVTGPRFVKEMYRGDAWKGNALVCEEILSILNQIFGQDVTSFLKEQFEYIDLISTIELKLQNIGLEPTGTIPIRIPRADLQKLTTEPLQEFINNSSFNKNVTLEKDKLKFSARFFRSFYDGAINYASGILDECISVIDKENFSKITLFVLGDCTKTPILLDVVKRKFEPSIKVIVPNSDTPVLDGALLCGFQ